MAGKRQTALGRMLEDYAQRVKQDFEQSGQRAGQGLGEVIEQGNVLTGIPRVVLGGSGAISAPISAALSPILGPLFAPVAEATDTYVGQPVERLTGYPADITNDVVMSAAPFGIAKALKPAAPMLSRLADQVESRANQAGYTFRRPEGTFFSGGGPVKLADDEGLVAYHGSPHSFDEFSMDKIGSGEGAQAYGHGLYFAENETVAKGYKDALKGNNLVLDGLPVERSAALDEVASRIKSAVPTAQQPFNSAKMLTEWWGKGMSPQQMRDRISKGGWDPEVKQELGQVVDAFESGIGVSPNQGSMYQVRLNVKPDELLDWDKPLSEQPKKVQEIFHDMKSDWTGGQISESSKLVSGDFNDKVAASEAMKARGIKGIRYLDAGSRDGGGGTYNYVIFDDKLINILKKYGIPMTVGAGGAMMVAGQDMPPEIATEMGGGA
jgi:hypothetical protein